MGEETGTPGGETEGPLDVLGDQDALERLPAPGEDEHPDVGFGDVLGGELNALDAASATADRLNRYPGLVRAGVYGNALSIVAGLVDIGVHGANVENVANVGTGGLGLYAALSESATAEAFAPVLAVYAYVQLLRFCVELGNAWGEGARDPLVITPGEIALIELLAPSDPALADLLDARRRRMQYRLAGEALAGDDAYDDYSPRELDEMGRDEVIRREVEARLAEEPPGFEDDVDAMHDLLVEVYAANPTLDDIERRVDAGADVLDVLDRTRRRLIYAWQEAQSYSTYDPNSEWGMWSQGDCVDEEWAQSIYAPERAQILAEGEEEYAEASADWEASRGAREARAEHDAETEAYEEMEEERRREQEAYEAGIREAERLDDPDWDFE